MAIKFGTDGWRAIMAEDFTFANLEIVVQAIVNYLKDNGKGKRGLFIGYDNRFLAEEFAEVAAKVLIGNGIKVKVAEAPLPTPVTAFAIQDQNLDGALMLTASHNPPTYNGIKFIPEHAGPAMPEITDQIEEQVAKVQETGKINRSSFKEAEAKIEKFDPKPAYLEHLMELLDLSAAQDRKLKVLADPMFGVGIGYLSQILEPFGIEIEEMNNTRDPFFGGGMPEPMASELPELIERVKKEDFDLGVALDGDADRFGIITEKGEYLVPNQVLFLLLDHLLENKGLTGDVVRTVATTHMLDKIAKENGMKIFETPVGFKYIGNAMLEKDILIGGEESGGLSIKGHIPEKDGLLACGLIIEMILAEEQQLSQILKGIENKYGKLLSERLDLECRPEDKEEVVSKIENFSKEELAGQKVIKRIDKDGMKLVLDDGSWCLMRPSGTEPVIRIYVETSDRKLMKKIQDDIRAELDI